MLSRLTCSTINTASLHRLMGASASTGALMVLRHGLLTSPRPANATIAPQFDAKAATPATVEPPMAERKVPDKPPKATIGERVFATRQEIEEYLQEHEVKGVSTPVRKEFLQPTPLTTSDLQGIDIHVYHRKPECISDHVAYRTVKLLRFFADAFFRKRYVHRAIVLETVAGVPGMVAGMFCHMRSLRRMERDGGWIEKLLREAENERMHLMIWMSVTRPTALERAIVTLAQGLFFNFYALVYLFFPRTAHRMVGYLEEEAIVSYNAFAKEIHQGHIDNSPAPQVAKDYYNLAESARLLDVVLAVRADEAAHRDANHNFADQLDGDDGGDKRSGDKV